MALKQIGTVARRVVGNSLAIARDRHIAEVRKALAEWDQTRKPLCLVRLEEHAEAAQRLALAATELEQARG